MNITRIGLSLALSACSLLGASMVGLAADGAKYEVIGGDMMQGESKEVMLSLENLLIALSEANTTKIESCLSDEVTICDAANHGAIFGKADVMEHIRKNVLGTGGGIKVTKLTVRNPYVSMKGDTAMVSFQATKAVTADEKPATYESWCSEVFQKQDGQWKVLHFQSNWKPVKNVK